MSGLMSRFGLKALAQWEQAHLLQEKGHGGLVTEAPIGGKGAHIKTHEFCKWVAETVGESQKILVVGHPDHVKRVATLLEYFGLKPMVSIESLFVYYDDRKLPGYQWWTRSPWVYIPWEYASRAVLFLKSLFGEL